MIEIDNSAGLCAKAMEAIIRKAIAAAISRCTKNGGDVSVAIMTDEAIQKLNREYRGIDAPTDVLSFAAEDEIAMPAGIFWGDIAISMDAALRQAEAFGHSLERELAFLAIHATLHLMGHDHMADSEDRHMQALQARILEEVGLPR